MSPCAPSLVRPASSAGPARPPWPAQTEPPALGTLFFRGHHGRVYQTSHTVDHHQHGPFAPFSQTGHSPSTPSTPNWQALPKPLAALLRLVPAPSSQRCTVLAPGGNAPAPPSPTAPDQPPFLAPDPRAYPFRRPPQRAPHVLPLIDGVALHFRHTLRAATTPLAPNSFLAPLTPVALHRRLSRPANVHGCRS